ncbi:hypothetical protein [Nocardioides litoris]|uniref:hypothetical protein n=1 Tax=Nocardioides litoris TaxID=1926648 RepID=UPI001476E636|nr:hypothetical protein [Nocardioides litoris]
MRLRRRAEESRATGPEGSVEVAFAGVLDGRRLWLAVARPVPTGAAFALRPGAAVPSTDTSDERHLAARLDLDGLAPASYDVVLAVPGGPDVPLVVPDGTVLRAATAPAATVRPRPERAPDERLRLRVEPLDPAVELAGVDLEPDGVRLDLGPDVADAPVHLVDDGGTVVASWPGPLLDDAAVADLAPQRTRVVVGDDRRPVRRRADGLADAGRGAPLPALGRLRLRWGGDGTLVARVAEDQGAGG